MRFIASEQLESVFRYEDFIPVLKEAFCGDYTVPLRHHHAYDNGIGEDPSTLLLMPAWSGGNYVGVKTVTVSPYNGRFDLPGIQGIYTLINARNGIPEAQLDAKALTAKRTAATSALASDFLAPADADTLLMVGTGALAPELIKAHSTVRPIKKVLIWGRNRKKADRLKRGLTLKGITVETVDTIEQGMRQAMIISVATLSPDPLILGKWLKPGQHLDLVGAYRPDMREADDEAVQRTSVFIDHAGAAREAGDLAIPLQTGILAREAIKATLFELCKAEKPGRTSADEITYFKSVGHALEDLSGALYLLEELKKQGMGSL